MTGNRKKLYIVVIVICFAATGGILYYGFGGSSTPPAPTIAISGSPNPIPTDNSGVVTSHSSPVFSGAPSVFPEDSKFDWTLLNSDKFQKLKSIPDLQLGPVGRDVPFNNP